MTCLLQSEKGRKRGGEGRNRSSSFGSHFFSERESSFSLEIRAIRPSVFFGTRRKAALRREGFVWAPDLRIVDKLLEVGVSPYLVLFFV